MEPVKLSISNFTSYADEQVDLSNVQLAAIVGRNGAGKSSLVDAMLWALFGEASKGGVRSLDNYVRRGQTEARVSLEFVLHGSRYRVTRLRSTRGKSHLELEQEISGAWQPMSGRNIAETQAAIEQLLRLDYRTFTASSLILQGKADSLTADMTDSERKDVLARILGLDLWDQLQDQARDRVREARAQAKALVDRASQSEATAARRGEVEASLATWQTAAESAAADMTAAQARVTELAARAEQRPALEAEQARLREQIARTESDIQTARADVAQIDRDAEQLRGAAARRQQVEEELAAAVPAAAEARRAADEADGRMNDLQARVQAASGAEQQLADVRQQIAARERDRSQIEADGRQARAALTQQREIVARADAIRQAADRAAFLSEELRRLDDAATRYAELDATARDLERQTADWDRDHETEEARIREQLTAAERQAELLTGVPCAGSELQPRCQLLGDAVLSSARAGELRARLEELSRARNPYVVAWRSAAKQRDDLGYDAAFHRKVREDLAQCETDARLVPVLEQAEQRVEELTEQLRDLTKRFQQVDADLKQLQTRRDELTRQVTEADALRQQLTTEQATASTLRARAEEARDRLTRLQEARQQAIAAVLEALPRLDELDRRRQTLVDRIQSLNAELEKARARQRTVDEQLLDSVGVAALLAEARAAFEGARQREIDAREQLGRLRAELDQIAAAEADVARVRDQVAGIERKALVYEVLEQACSKKAGVPALIVENAVPQIETLCNDLIARMAGGRLAVRLDTQAETKSGTLTEVLRITVLDNGTERPYQTFSGAERFMVDLSLRIALSKFLAHRAGAEIRFLVLDEGLGSLDAANRQQVMEAILVAAREFGRTLIVTHIAELQDALPQRIEVRREPDGSRVEVVA